MLTFKHYSSVMSKKLLLASITCMALSGMSHAAEPILKKENQSSVIKGKTSGSLQFDNGPGTLKLISNVQYDQTGASQEFYSKYHVNFGDTGIAQSNQTVDFPAGKIPFKIISIGNKDNSMKYSVYISSLNVGSGGEGISCTALATDNEVASGYPGRLYSLSVVQAKGYATDGGHMSKEIKQSNICLVPADGYPDVARLYVSFDGKHDASGFISMTMYSQRSYDYEYGPGITVHIPIIDDVEL